MLSRNGDALEKGRGSKWSEVIQELETQRRLLHDLILEEESRQSLAHTRHGVVSVRGRSSTCDTNEMIQTCLQERLERENSEVQSPLSPSPVPGDTHRWPLLSPSADVLAPRIGRSLVYEKHLLPPSNADAKLDEIREQPQKVVLKAAIQALAEELSTSSWSSDESDCFSGRVTIGGNRNRCAVEEVHPQSSLAHLTSGSSRFSSSLRSLGDGRLVSASRAQRFYVEILKITEEEYDGRQALVMEEMSSFTDISSAFLNAMFFSLRPHRL